MLLFRKKLLLAKIEATYGTDSVPTGAANSIQAQNIQITPMQGSDVDRALELPYFGSTGTIPVDMHYELSFDIQMAGSGAAGTPPAWGVLLRGCAMAETITAGQDVVYNPITDDPESLTVSLHIDQVLFKLLGARGTVQFTLNASGIPTASFTFMGLWEKPTDQSVPGASNYSAWRKPDVASTVNTPVATIAGSDHVVRNFSLNVGNQVEPRFLIGAESIIIANRAAQLETQIEAKAISTFDPFAAALDQTELALALTHGTQAGDRIAFDIPRAQIQRPDSPADAQGIMEWPLRMVPLPGTGNDEFTITVS